MTTATPTLHAKLAEVMGAIEWQPKTGRNQQQGYNFVSVERIKDTVRDQLSQRRVMVYVSTKAIDHSEYTTKSLTTMFHVFVQGEVTFADADSGEMFTIEAAGEGTDSSDKALSKAITAMTKYALINTFLIPTGDDPDVETPDAKEPATRKAVNAGGRSASNPTPAPTPEEPAFPKPQVVPMVQCESRSPYTYDGMTERTQCRKEQGHTGPHKASASESWSDADAKSAPAASQPKPVA